LTPPASRSALDPACPQDDWPFTDGTALLVNHGGPAHRRQTTEHMKRRLAQTCWGVDASPADLPGRPANDGREAQKPTTGAAVLRPYKAAASYVRRVITSQQGELVVWALHRPALPVHYLQPASLIGLAPPMVSCARYSAPNLCSSTLDQLMWISTWIRSNMHGNTS